MAFTSAHTVTGPVYLDILPQWLIPQLQEEVETLFINKAGLHLIFIMMSVGTSMIHFAIVGLDVLLKMTLLLFHSLQGYLI